MNYDPYHNPDFVSTEHLPKGRRFITTEEYEFFCKNPIERKEIWMWTGDIDTPYWTKKRMRENGFFKGDSYVTYCVPKSFSINKKKNPPKTKNKKKSILTPFRPRHYILNENGEPVAEPDLKKWAQWFEKEYDGVRKIGYDEIGEITISTVFLGLNHQHGDGSPILFETMIFGGEHDQYQNRYETKEQAVAGHNKAVTMVMEEIANKNT